MKKVLALVWLAIVFNACQKPSDVEITFDNRFLDFINAYSSGVISKMDHIAVELSSQITLPETVSKDLFSISPSVDGSLVKSGQSLIFKPSKPLKSGTQYVVDLALGDLVDVTEELKTFQFAVKTIEQDFSIQTEELRTTNLDQPEFLELNGVLSTADFEEIDVIEKMIDAEGKQVVWEHTGNDHQFKVLNIKREDEVNG